MAGVDDDWAASAKEFEAAQAEALQHMQAQGADTWNMLDDEQVSSVFNFALGDDEVPGVGVAPSTIPISAPPTFEEDGAGGLGLGGLGGLGGLTDATSLATAQPADGDFSLDLTMAAGLSAADLEAHLTATLGGLVEDAPAPAPAPAHAPAPAPPAPTGGAWSTGPPSAPGPDLAAQQAAQAAAASAHAQHAAAVAGDLASRIPAAAAHLSMLESRLADLAARGSKATAQLAAVKAAEVGEGEAPAPAEGAPDGVLGGAPATPAALEEAVAGLQTEYNTAYAEWQQTGQAVGGMRVQFAQASAVAKAGGYPVPSLVSPPTGVGALAGVSAYGYGPWPVARPRKKGGKYMKSGDLEFIGRALGNSLRRTGMDPSRAAWYAHALRAKRVQAAAAAAGDPLPSTASLFPPSAIPSAAAAQAALLAGTGTVSRAVRSREWETSLGVLGRADKGALNKPRRILNIGDAADVSKGRLPLLELLRKEKEAAEAKAAAAATAAKAAEEAAVLGEEEGEAAAGAKAGGKKKGGKGKGRKGRGGKKAGGGGVMGPAAAELLAAALSAEGVGGGSNPLGAAKAEGAPLWTTRALIDALGTARLAYEDAALTFQAVQSSGARATPLALQATQVAASQGLLDVGEALGLTAVGSGGGPAWPEDGATDPAPSEAGSALLASLVSLTKGKKQVLAALAHMPPTACKVLVTAAMVHLPHFIASMDPSPQAAAADDRMAGLLEAYVQRTSPAVQGEGGAPPAPLAVAGATLSLLSHWLQALLEHSDAPVVFALLQVAGGARVITTLLERGEGICTAVPAPEAGAAGAEAWTAAFGRWQALTEALAGIVAEQAQAGMA